MLIWLYTEDNDARRDGPFYTEEDAMNSPLWEAFNACAWIEGRTGFGNGYGWVYENSIWNGCEWIITSSGVIPIEPIRPEYLLEAEPVMLAA